MPAVLLAFCVTLAMGVLALWTACSESETGAAPTPASEAQPAPADPASVVTRSTGDEAEEPEGAGGAGGAEREPSAAPEDAAPPPVEPSVVTPERLEIGRAAYQAARCSMCHGRDGAGGGLGPNLTDDTWAHSDGSVEGIRAVLIEGVSRAQMKSTAYRMPMQPIGQIIQDEDQILALAQYVWSLSQD